MDWTRVTRPIYRISKIDNKRHTFRVCLDVEIENFREVEILNNSNDSIELLLILNIFVWIQRFPVRSWKIGITFFQCNSCGRLWYTITYWLGISFVSHGDLRNHSFQFGGLGEFAKNSHSTFNIVWVSMIFTI